MKHLILSFALLASASPLVVCAAPNKDLKMAGTLLESGVYELSSDLTIDAASGTSALTIAERQTVTIYLKNNVTLTLKGGAANGTTGAGAGIQVPESSSLYLTGEGTVVATGGNAASGGNAGNGTNASVSSSKRCEICGGTHSAGGGSFVNGHGGGGGYGGGGAGAGIGGKGGNGGAGGARGEGDSVRYDHAEKFHKSGNDGGNGGNGSNGGSAGKVYVLGSVIVKATGGSSAANGSTSSSYGSHFVKRLGDDWLAAGGAPGGAGQGGAAAEGIGFGGAGGAGGGGGGSGGFFQFDNIGEDTGHDCSGGSCEDDKFRPGCGRNGWEGDSAEVYTATDYTCYDGNSKIGSARSGHGGCAGALARNGTPGELYATPTTSITLKPVKAVEQLANVAVNLPAVTLTFQDGDTTVGTKTVALGAAFPAPPTCGKHDHEVFTGWYLDNRCCYDAAGVALLSASPLMEDVTLKAKWIPDASILEVTDLASFRKALDALAADATLVGKSGQRRVTFKGAPVIELSEKLEIPESVGKLQLCGPATIRSNQEVELNAECVEVYAENLTIEKLKFSAKKLTLFNVAVRGSKDSKSNGLWVSGQLFASSTTLDSIWVAPVLANTTSLLVNSTVINATCEQLRFVNVTSVGDRAVDESLFINSLNFPSGTALKEYTIHGVTHKYVEPTAAALEGAVDIYYDPTGENVAKLENGKAVAIVGHASLATRRLSLDQLGGVRKAPTKGAIRLVTDQPTLAIEAKTDEGRYVAEKLAVDSETTSVDIPGGSANAEVVTTPYALVAATVDLLSSETDLAVKGDAVVSMVEASGLVATNLVVNSERFSANSLDAMSAITLEDASLQGGELQWFGSTDLVKADLRTKTFSGGDEHEVRENLLVAARSARTESFVAAKSDALAQIVVTTTAKPGVRLKVVSSAYAWTDSTPIGSSGKSVTKIYTIPLRKGEIPSVEIGNDSGSTIWATLAAHYIYFGVEE